MFSYLQSRTLGSGFISWVNSGKFQPEKRIPVSYPRELTEGLSLLLMPSCCHTPNKTQGQCGLFAFPDTDLAGKRRETSDPGPSASSGCYHRANTSLLAGWILVNRKINRLKANRREIPAMET